MRNMSDCIKKYRTLFKEQVEQLVGSVGEDKFAVCIQ